MENNTYTDKIADTKIDSYGYDELKNFKANGELLVTITLYEYRELLQAAANAKASEARSDYYKAEERAKTLEKELEGLKKAFETLKRTDIDPEELR